MLNKRIAALTLAVLLALGSVLSWAEAELPAKAESVRPIALGQAMPAFKVNDRFGATVTYQPGEPTVIVTYRGGWCPYCNTQLQDLRKVIPTLDELGVRVWFLSGDSPDDLYASLQDKTQAAIEGLGYTILSDANLDAARKLGIAFQAPPRTIDYVASKGVIDGSAIGQHQALAVPSVFVVDASGVIRYRFFDPDYKSRLPADDLLAQVRAALAI
jgi:peroxiredoxin